MRGFRTRSCGRPGTRSCPEDLDVEPLAHGLDLVQPGQHLTSSQVVVHLMRMTQIAQARLALGQDEEQHLLPSLGLANVMPARCRGPRAQLAEGNVYL